MSDYELVNELSESTTARVDPSNVEQLAAWDGDAGAYWAAHADRFDEGVAGYRDQFLAAAAIDATAKVLDVGCGSGQATRDAARCATAGSALGGFEDVALWGLSEPMYFGPDPDDAFRFISGQHAAMVRDLDADTRSRALDDLRASMGNHQTERGVYYDSAAWLIEARRT